MSDELALTPPEPVGAVAAQTADSKVKLSAEETAKLDAQVTAFVDVFLHAEPESETFRTQADAVANLAKAELESSAKSANRMLERPLAARKALEQKTGVAKNLTDLRNVIESLDPATQGNMLAPRRLLGILPFGGKLRKYFDRYTTAQAQLDAIITVLYRGKDELLHDNAAIENEKAAMWAIMQKLRAAVYLCERLDQAIEQGTAALAQTDPDRAKSLRDDVLLPARQRRVDLLTQLAVNVQGYQVLDILKRNNLELVKGVDRATTTTISALRTAVTASQALAGQRLVLNQVSALNATTGAMIESTSQLLGTQGVAIHEQASQATVDIDRLKAAFTNIYAAMDAVDAYKAKALTNLSASAESLTTEIARAEERLKK